MWSAVSAGLFGFLWDGLRAVWGGRTIQTVYLQIG